MKSTLVISVFSAWIILSVIYTGEAFALERHCEAFYLIEPQNVSDPPIEFGSFVVKGSCGNKIVANRCRERARDRAHRCMSDQLKSIPLELKVNQGNYQPPPIACREESFDSSEVLQYPFTKMGPHLKDFVCNKYGDFRRSYEGEYPVVKVNVVAMTKGGKRCGHKGVSRRWTFRCDPGEGAVMHPGTLFDLETGYSSGWGKKNNLNYDLIWFCGPQDGDINDTYETLRALEGVSWSDPQTRKFSMGQDTIQKARFSAQKDIISEYPDIFSIPAKRAHNQIGKVYFIKTAEGNYAKLRIREYDPPYPKPGRCRYAIVEYEVFFP